MPSQSLLDETTSGPSAPWLAAGILLAGFGTVLLGPILPAVASNWRLTDSQSGLLIFAKFLGAFLGGISVPRRLRTGIFAGTAVAALGFGAFGFCTSLATGSLAMFLGGIGLGLIIASTNILAGLRYRSHTGSALASLNFFWSAGAVGCGLLIALLMPRFGLRNLLLYLAAALLVAGLGGNFVRNREASSLDLDPAEPAALPRSALISFALLLFLYGGLETCLTGWLTTYSLRYSGKHLLGGQSAIVLLWTSLTIGRALASVVLRYVRESIVQRTALLCAFVFIAALATARTATALSLDCILLGLSLASFFPSTFGLLMRRSPPARTAGFILAVSGLGAAAFPWLMGVVSTHTGSLRIAMGVPMSLALLLLLVSVIGIPNANHSQTLPIASA